MHGRKPICYSKGSHGFVGRIETATAWPQNAYTLWMRLHPRVETAACGCLEDTAGQTFVGGVHKMLAVAANSMSEQPCYLSHSVWQKGSSSLFVACDALS